MRVRVPPSPLNQGTYNNNKKQGFDSLIFRAFGELAQWLERMTMAHEINKVPFYFD